MVRNADFEARFRALVDEVTRVLPNVVADMQAGGLLGKLDQGLLPTRWGRVLSQQMRHAFFEVIRGQLADLPAHRSLLDYAVSDATIRGYGLRGTSYQAWDESSPYVSGFYKSMLDGQVRFSVERRLVSPFLRRVTELLLGAGLGPLSSGQFERLYAGIEAEVFDDKAIYRLLAPLYWVGFAALPIALGDGISICRMTQQERDLWMGADDNFGVSARRFVQVGLDTAIQIDVRQSLSTQMPGEGAILNDQSRLERLRHVLLALRLFKGGAIVSPGVAHGWLDSWRGDQWYLQPVESFRVSPGGQLLHFDEGECGRLSAFWSRFAKSTQGLAESNPLQIALRRFDRAVLSGNPSDRLIDCCIAFDALFAPSDQLELTHRVCLRLAFLIGRDAAHRRELFEVAKAAYGARGGIVHGSKSAAGAFGKATKHQYPQDSGKVEDDLAVLRGAEFLDKKVLPLLHQALLKFLYSSITGDDLDQNIIEAGERLKDLGSDAPHQVSGAGDSPASP